MEKTPMEKTPTENPRFNLQTCGELFAEGEQKLEWLIENIWVDKARGLIAGNPGVGKTWLALDMLISVATGGKFLNQFQAKKGNVLLVEEEASKWNLSRRLGIMARNRNLMDPADPDISNNIFLLTRQFTRIPADAVELFHIIVDNNIKLAVFDSLREVHSGDENSSTEMKGVLDSFARLNTTTDCAIVLIHHLAKGNEMSNKPLFERLRGSSHFWAWRDCLIGMEGEEESDISTVSFQFRDAESPGSLVVKRYQGQTFGGISLGVIPPEQLDGFNEKSREILDFIYSKLDPVSQNTIFSAVKGNRAKVMQTIKQMADLKLIEKYGGGYVIPTDTKVVPSGNGTSKGSNKPFSTSVGTSTKIDFLERARAVTSRKVNGRKKSHQETSLRPEDYKSKSGDGTESARVLDGPAYLVPPLEEPGKDRERSPRLAERGAKDRERSRAMSDPDGILDDLPVPDDGADMPDSRPRT